VVKEALALAKVKPLVIDFDDPEYPTTRPIPRASASATLDYEDFIAQGDEDFAWSMPDDEWDAISLNYTSGTTGNPKGVVYHHRGAALMAYTNTIHAGMGKHASICGRCRCSTATAGAFPGRSPCRPARMSACAGCGPRRCTTRSPTTASRICAARRSSCRR
jgi:acyl-CoA synthetase (AMP-forming)/AMP-acid ligase II